ncbi:septum site-determining protein MinC [Ramlibacter sp.]|uniref:septum site-determining protein MinC n=1 Tax=Ramlibacter sp. TaxID=1917967 RepID=UPI00181C582C|nr:septum site-determining protein MinC [Ramlibacter sp.]MBA2675475.1 septum site-determining protein MinC [Ramlibacter sp.]
MSVALAGRAPATFEIKSAQLPLVALLLKSADLQRLAEELHARFGDLPDFFDQDPLVIDLAPLQPQGDTPVDFPALLALLRRYRVMPIAAKGGSTAQMEAANAAGLAAAPDTVMAAPTPARAEKKTAQPPAAESAPQAVAAPQSAMVLDKPLRSGQQIYARGRDLVVMAMVNPGAEVIADGNIHVYAPLRGKAMAGARGNADARIFTLALDPELVSIAGVYRTSETPWPDALRGKAAQVRLAGGDADGKLLLEALKT